MESFQFSQKYSKDPASFAVRFPISFFVLYGVAPLTVVSQAVNADRPSGLSAWSNPIWGPRFAINLFQLCTDETLAWMFIKITFTVGGVYILNVEGTLQAESSWNQKYEAKERGNDSDAIWLSLTSCSAFTSVLFRPWSIIWFLMPALSAMLAGCY